MAACSATLFLMNSTNANLALIWTLFAVLWLVLIYCERKVLLVGWWLVAAAGLVWEKNTVGWMQRTEWCSFESIEIVYCQRAMWTTWCFISDENQNIALQFSCLTSNCWPCLVAKFKIPKLSHRMRILHTWSIKCRQNKKLIAFFCL